MVVSKEINFVENSYKFFAGLRPTLVILAVTLALTGCTSQQSKPLHSEERHHSIDPIRAELDIASAGAVTDGSYDAEAETDNPSFYGARISGDTAYQILSDRIRDLPEVEECVENETQLTCRSGQVEILLTRDDIRSQMVVLKLTDPSRGRD